GRRVDNGGMRTVRAMASAVAICAAAELAAQQPVFRSGVDYVQLDVVATDSNDRVVRGLTKADFQITERGRAQTIAGLQFIDIPPSHRTVTDVTTAAPTIDVVSNTHSPTSRQWVVVIDDLHIIELHLRQTRQLVQQLLESVPGEDQVAIVFVGRSDLSQGFTSDLGAQMRTVGRLKDALGLACDAADVGGWRVGGPPSEDTPRLVQPASKPPVSADAFGDAVAAASRPDPAERDRHRYALATVDVLKNISAALVRSTYPRKALVYV